MNFFEKYTSNLTTGNLALTTILTAGILGMSGYLLNDFHTQKNVEGQNSELLTEDAANYNIKYGSDVYNTHVSFYTIIVLAGVCLGVLLSKINSQYIGSEYLKQASLFLFAIIALVMIVLTNIPFSDDVTSTEDIEKTYRSYEITAISLIAIIVGTVLHHADIFEDNKIMGLSVFLALAVVILGLVSYQYTTLVTKNEEDDYDRTLGEHFGRELSHSEKNVFYTTLAFSAVIVAGGIFHMYLERKHLVGKGRKTSPRRSPVRKSSPKRKSSPRRKLGSLRP